MLFFCIIIIEGDVFEEIALALELRQTCLILWPKLDGLNGQPYWLQRIVTSLTPIFRDTDYPSFVPVPFSLRGHAHLIDCGFTWSSISAFAQESGAAAQSSPFSFSSLFDLRPLCIIGQLSCVGKFTDQQPVFSSVIAFLQKLTFSLIPPQSSQSAKKVHSWLYFV